MLGFMASKKRYSLEPKIIYGQQSSCCSKSVSYTVESGQGRNFIALLQPTKEGDGAITWVKTQPNVVKVTVDASIFGDREEIDFGFVARNSKGELIEARTVIHKMLASPVTV